jgi:hypothetical protein
LVTISKVDLVNRLYVEYYDFALALMEAASFFLLVFARHEAIKQGKDRAYSRKQLLNKIKTFATLGLCSFEPFYNYLCNPK